MMGPEMESPAAVGAAHGANSEAVQLASQIIADFTGEVHSADHLVDLISLAQDAIESNRPTEQSLAEARSYLIEALDLIEGAAQ
ncbi:hypothetical protein [Ruixingdingia sedimenti]|uniref:Uncharacterized protein n=1 Tax=Ruixingdingia sedimenti TaxID=3073604 RepID=A0ABU1F283_9RHOB|nr:hypothetical protein [Xinfangfangia sp. LG-4]MDR5650975.1 hypothetical protein [Xinfangfangia sp. LG-4]